MRTNNTDDTESMPPHASESPMMEIDETPQCESENAVVVDKLTFAYSPLYEKDAPIVLDEASMKLPKGARCLLIGGNGAGKTTLLNVLGGKHMHHVEAVTVCGQPAFHNTHPAISIISGNWVHAQAYGCHSIPYAKDISVQEMIDNHPFKDVARAEVITKVLDVDLAWRMHRVSDGQRRRVQLLLGLMKSFQVLLLDEVTVDLDVVTRSDLLNYLKDECDTRGATIVYATHIFDGLEHWATHINRLCAGKVIQCGPVSEFKDFQSLLDARAPSPLLKVVLSWLEEEEKASAGRYREANAKGAPVDLKLCEYKHGDKFAHNRMHNRTC